MILDDYCNDTGIGQKGPLNDSNQGSRYMDQPNTQSVKRQNPTRDLKAKQIQEVTPEPTGVKRVFKGEREAIHDLFELEEAKFKANKSWKFNEPEIVEVPHKHHYHTCDRNGRPQTVSSENVGHFHYITYQVNPDGTMNAKCGPPMRTVHKRIRGQDRTIIEPVFYGAKNVNEVDEETGKKLAVVDEHTHEMKYLHAEKLKV